MRIDPNDYEASEFIVSEEDVLEYFAQCARDARFDEGIDDMDEDDGVLDPWDFTADL